MTASDTPTWIRSPYITQGYRFNFSALDCLQSLTQWHNETCNVWTHLIGMFLFMGTGIYRFEVSLHEAPLPYQLAFFSFYAAVSICMLFSAAYHLFGCLGEAWHVSLYRLDMTGICLMVFGSYLPALVIAFSCYPHLAKVYITLIAIVIGGAIVCQNLEACLHPRWFHLRIATTLSSVFFAVAPCSHWLMLSTEEQHALLVPVVSSTVGLYCAGFCVWASKFPERFWPGKFDYVCNSHNLWHSFVVLAAVAWDYGLHKCLDVMKTGAWVCPPDSPVGQAVVGWG